jgi:hypothetical protein
MALEVTKSGRFHLWQIHDTMLPCPTFRTDFPLHPSCSTILLPLKVFWQICFGVRLLTFPIAPERGCQVKKALGANLYLRKRLQHGASPKSACVHVAGLFAKGARANSLRSRCLLYFRTLSLFGHCCARQARSKKCQRQLRDARNN